MIVLPRRFKPILACLVVLGITLVLPFTTNIQRAAAAQMDHMSDGTPAACQSYCARLSTTPNQLPVLNEDEIKPPRPSKFVVEPYYLQFEITGYRLTDGSSIINRRPVDRPPDIVALTTNYRL